MQHGQTFDYKTKTAMIKKQEAYEEREIKVLSTLKKQGKNGGRLKFPARGVYPDAGRL
ncbi:MAG: hypothetical protein LBO67_06995 [Spirochaetaceae bacterium]|jgi:hypothetical protein|nr:hypothetical protein [Spirochaetaceae bacterium]